MKQWITGAALGLMLVGSCSAVVRAQDEISGSPAPLQKTGVKIYVTGAVKNPGIYRVDSDQLSTKRGLFSVLRQAGLEEVDFNKPLEVVHGQKISKLGLLAEAKNEKAEELTAPSGVTLQDGDVLKVPTRTTSIHVSGMGIDVTNSNVPLPENGELSLKEALALAHYSPYLSESTRPLIKVWRNEQKSEFLLSALEEGKPEILLHDTDYVYVSMDLLEHVSIVGDVNLKGNFYFPKDDHPTIADIIKRAQGIAGKETDDIILIFHTHFLGEGKNMVVRHSLAAQIPVALDPNDPQWQQRMEHYDMIFVVGARNVPDMVNFYSDEKTP